MENWMEHRFEICHNLVEKETIDYHSIHELVDFYDQHTTESFLQWEKVALEKQQLLL